MKVSDLHSILLSLSLIIIKLNNCNRIRNRGFKKQGDITLQFGIKNFPSICDRLPEKTLCNYVELLRLCFKYL